MVFRSFSDVGELRSASSFLKGMDFLFEYSLVFGPVWTVWSVSSRDGKSVGLCVQTTPQKPSFHLKPSTM